MAKKTAPKKTAPKKETAPKATAPKEEKVNGYNLLAEEVAAEVGKELEEVLPEVKAVFNAIMNLNAEGTPVELLGFGKFEVRTNAARKGRNPQTGEEIQIAESISPALKTGGTYKNRVKAQTPERKTPVEKKSKAVEAEVDEQPVEAPKKKKKRAKKKKK